MKGCNWRIVSLERVFGADDWRVGIGSHFLEGELNIGKIRMWSGVPQDLVGFG